METILHSFASKVVDAQFGISTEESVVTLRNVLRSESGVTVVMRNNEVVLEFKNFARLMEDTFSIVIRPDSPDSISVYTTAKRITVMNREVTFPSVAQAIRFIADVNSYQSVDVTANGATFDLNDTYETEE